MIKLLQSDCTVYCTCTVMQWGAEIFRNSQDISRTGNFGPLPPPTSHLAWPAEAVLGNSAVNMAGLADSTIQQLGNCANFLIVYYSSDSSNK